MEKLKQEMEDTLDCIEKANRSDEDSIERVEQIIAEINARSSNMSAECHYLFDELRSVINAKERELLSYCEHIRNKCIEAGKIETDKCRSRLEASQQTREDLKKLLESSPEEFKENVLSVSAKAEEVKSELMRGGPVVSDVLEYVKQLSFCPDTAHIKSWITSYCFPSRQDWVEEDTVMVVSPSHNTMDTQGHFWLHEPVTPTVMGHLSLLSQTLTNMIKASHVRLTDAVFVPGTICAAFYPHDNLWHRAIVEKVSSSDKVPQLISVRYVDYGNVHDLYSHLVTALPSKLKDYPFQCRRCRFSEDPSIQWCVSRDVKWMFNDLTRGQNLTATVKKKVTPPDLAFPLFTVELMNDGKTDVGEEVIRVAKNAVLKQKENYPMVSRDIRYFGVSRDHLRGSCSPSLPVESSVDSTHNTTPSHSIEGVSSKEMSSDKTEEGVVSKESKVTNEGVVNEEGVVTKEGVVAEALEDGNILEVPTEEDVDNEVSEEVDVVSVEESVVSAEEGVVSAEEGVVSLETSEVPTKDNVCLKEGVVEITTSLTEDIESQVKATPTNEIDTANSLQLSISTESSMELTELSSSPQTIDHVHPIDFDSESLQDHVTVSDQESLTSKREASISQQDDDSNMANSDTDTATENEFVSTPTQSSGIATPPPAASVVPSNVSLVVLNATPPNTTPTDAIPPNIAPSDVTPPNITLSDATPPNIAPSDATPPNITPSDAAKPTEAASPNIMPPSATPPEVIPTDAMPPVKTPPKLELHLGTDVSEDMGVVSKGSPTSTLHPSVKQGAQIEVTVNSLLDTAGHFWCQLLLEDVESELYSNLFDKLQEHAATKGQYTPVFFSPGDVCMSMFSEDNQWYRGVVEDNGEECQLLVRFVDYGNIEMVPIVDVMALKSDFRQLPFQAIHCSLATEDKDEFTDEEIKRFDEIVQENSSIFATVVSIDDGNIVLVRLSIKDENDSTDILQLLTGTNKKTRTYSFEMPPDEENPEGLDWAERMERDLLSAAATVHSNSDLGTNSKVVNDTFADSDDPWVEPPPPTHTSTSKKHRNREKKTKSFSSRSFSPAGIVKYLSQEENGVKGKTRHKEGRHGGVGKEEDSTVHSRKGPPLSHRYPMGSSSEPSISRYQKKYSPAPSGENVISLYVTGIPSSYSHDRVSEGFRKYGRVYDVRSALSKTTPRSVMFFVDMKEEDAKKAMECLNGVKVPSATEGLVIKLDRYKKRFS